MRKIFFISILIHFASYSNAQEYLMAATQKDLNDFGYYFKGEFSFRDEIIFDKNKKYSKADSLNLFIADSIQFHKNYSYYYQKQPHVCQNRFYKMGVVNKENEVVIPFTYDWVQTKYDKNLIVVKEHRVGVIDSMGNIIIPFIAKGVVIKSNTLIAIQKLKNDSTIYFYNGNGKSLFSLKAFSAALINDYYVRIDGTDTRFKGVVDLKGNWVVQPNKYDYISWIENGFAGAYKNGKYGVIDMKGNEVLPFMYNNIVIGHINQFIVYKDGQSGVLDKNNKLVIPFDSSWKDNYGSWYFLRYGDSTVMLDIKSKKKIIGNLHVFAPAMNNNNKSGWQLEEKDVLIITDKKTNKQGMFRADGLEIFPIGFYNVNYSKDKKLVIVSKNPTDDKYLFNYAAYNLDGKIVVPFSPNGLQFISSSSKLLLSTNEKRQSAFVNIETGLPTTPYEYNGLGGYESQLPFGYVGAKKNFQLALISPEGKALTQAVYSHFYLLSDFSKTNFDKEIICIARRVDALVGITNTGEEIQIKK